MRKEEWNTASSRCLWAGLAGGNTCVPLLVWSCLSVNDGVKADTDEHIGSSLSRAQTSRVTHFACYREKRGCVRYAGLLLGHMGNTLGAKVPADVYKKSERARKKHDVERRKKGQLYLGRKNAPLGFLRGLYVLSFVFLHGKSVWTPGWGWGVLLFRHADMEHMTCTHMHANTPSHQC